MYKTNNGLYAFKAASKNAHNLATDVAIIIASTFLP